MTSSDFYYAVQYDIKGIVSRDTVVCQMRELMTSLGPNNPPHIGFTPKKE
jgi:hypothetical protein